MTYQIDTLRMGAAYWAENVLLALDQLLNALLWGDPQETLSRRAGQARERRLWWGCRLCEWLDTIDPEHCKSSLERIGREEGENSVPERLSRWRAENYPYPIN